MKTKKESTRIASFLESIPRETEPHKVFSDQEQFINFISFFDAIEIKPSKNGVMIRAKSEVAWYFLQSLARFYEKEIPFVSNWEKPGINHKFTISSLLTWGTELLYLMEKRRTEDFNDKFPIRRLELAQVIIKTKIIGSNEPGYLMQFDDKSNQYQFIGGRKKPIDKNIEKTMIRKLSEELPLNKLFFNKNYSLKTLFLNKTIKSISPTFGVFSEYKFNLFECSLEIDNLKLGTLDKWITAKEIRAGLTKDGVKISNEARYELHMHRKYENLELSLQTPQIDRQKESQKTLGKKRSSSDNILKKYISSGESEMLEFKSSLRWDERNKTLNKALEKVIVKVISSFMNSNGGVLLIGIDDEGKVLGIEDDLKTLNRKNKDGFVQQIINLITSMLGVTFCNFVNISFGQIDNKEIAVVRVESSTAPVFVKEGEAREFYIRAGNTSRMLNTEEVYKYIQLHW